MPRKEGLGLVRVNGPVVQNWQLAVTRELTPEDLHKAETTVKNVETPILRKVSARHHAMARRIASGQSLTEAAIASGYVPSRASLLRDDPTFQELVTFYREKYDAEYADFHEQMSGLATDAIIEMRDRFEQDPEQFKNGQLLSIITATADRTGYGPSSKSEVNVTVGLADRLVEARRRIAEQRRTIDVTPVREAAE